MAHRSGRTSSERPSKCMCPCSTPTGSFFWKAEASRWGYFDIFFHSIEGENRIYKRVCENERETSNNLDAPSSFSTKLNVKEIRRMKNISPLATELKRQRLQRFLYAQNERTTRAKSSKWVFRWDCSQAEWTCLSVIWAGSSTSTIHYLAKNLYSMSYSTSLEFFFLNWDFRKIRKSASNACQGKGMSKEVAL